MLLRHLAEFSYRIPNSRKQAQVCRPIIASTTLPQARRQQERQVDSLGLSRKSPFVSSRQAHRYRAKMPSRELCRFKL